MSAQAPTLPAAISEALDSIKVGTSTRSVFYSGVSAFVKDAPLYILGLNPGGEEGDTVDISLGAFASQTEDYSAYAEERWPDEPHIKPGTSRMQRSVRHMLTNLKLEPYQVPASNLIFLSSRNEKGLKDKSSLLETCWPVHQAVIDTLRVRTILCFGQTAGNFVRKKLGADIEVGRYTETNNRRWTSRAHSMSDNPTSDNLVVVTVTHPSWADWRNEKADPTPLVKRMLERV
jgi:hypothetical protein